MSNKGMDVLPPDESFAETSRLRAKAQRIVAQGPEAIAAELRRVEQGLTAHTTVEYPLRLMLLATATMAEAQAGR